MSASPFAEKNHQRRTGRDRVGNRAYREARALRRALNGTFGQSSTAFWQEAAIGTQGENQR